MKLRSKMLAALAATSIGWSMAASADEYSDAYALYAAWNWWRVDACSIWHHDFYEWQGCMDMWRSVAMSNAATASGNLNPASYEQFVYYYFFYMVAYGSS